MGKLNKKEFFSVLKCTGGFIAWVIGSGFATGQEILQFFTSYGYKSFAVLSVNLAGFVILGAVLMVKGFENRDDTAFDHYSFYCGKYLGKVYSVVLPVTLILLMAVIISAAGATAEQYFSVKSVIGSAAMGILVLLAYLLGFKKMVNLVSSIGPFIIVFVVFVGIFTSARDISIFGKAAEYSGTLSQFSASPSWLLSALLYLGINFLCGSTYYTELGKTALTRRAALTGAVIGAAAVIITIGSVNLAILLNAGDTAQLEVPTLFLAQKISPVFGAVFSVILILGMFSSCCTMVWSFCSGFFRNDKKKNRIFSACSIALCLVLGFFPFGGLMAVIYPLIGYSGLIFIFCVLLKPFLEKRKAKPANG